MNILAIGPHPDDIEFGCAHVLLKEVNNGHRVRMLVLSRGEAGTAGTPAIREEESKAAARLMGAELVFLDLGGDCHLEYAPRHAFQVASQIREFRPEIVLAPHPDENQHPDHAVAARLTRDACRFARYGGLAELRELATHKIANLFFYHITQHLHRPDIVIDISDVMNDWEAVMNCHQTQVKNKSYVDLQKTAARLLGISIGVEYAAGLYLSDPIHVEGISQIARSAREF